MNFVFHQVLVYITRDLIIMVSFDLSVRELSEIDTCDIAFTANLEIRLLKFLYISL